VLQEIAGAKDVNFTHGYGYAGVKDGNFTHGYGYPWTPYPHGYFLMPLGSTHILPAKLWIGHGYDLVLAGIPILCPFIFNFLCDTSNFVDL
jgi:hypothetical protein